MAFTSIERLIRASINQIDRINFVIRLRMISKSEFLDANDRTQAIRNEVE